jgi:hypothetical protein
VSGWVRAWWSRVVSGLAITAVAAVAGVISYDHIYELTLALHRTPMVARLMPFGVDGLIVTGSVILMQSGGWLGWLGVGPGVAISLFANVESGIAYGWLAAAWAGIPAVSFSLATFMLERWLSAQARQARASDGQQQEPDAFDVALSAYRESAETGQPLSAWALAAQHGISRRIAGRVVARALAETNGHCRPRPRQHQSAPLATAGGALWHSEPRRPRRPSPSTLDGRTSAGSAISGRGSAMSGTSPIWGRYEPALPRRGLSATG